MMEPTCCLRILLVMCGLIATGYALRADKQPNFKMCPGKQLGRLESVYADGPGCKRRNGADQWPCFIRRGRDGFFQINFRHDVPVEFAGLRSSIHAHVKVRGISSLTGGQKIGLSGEVDKDACPATFYDSVEGPYYGCPIQPGVVHSIRKKITVPNSVRFAQQNMNVEFKLTNLRGDTIICFTAPILNV